MKTNYTDSELVAAAWEMIHQEFYEYFTDDNTGVGEQSYLAELDIECEDNDMTVRPTENSWTCDHDPYRPLRVSPGPKTHGCGCFSDTAKYTAEVHTPADVRELLTEVSESIELSSQSELFDAERSDLLCAARDALDEYRELRAELIADGINGEALDDALRRDFRREWRHPGDVAASFAGQDGYRVLTAKAGGDHGWVSVDLDGNVESALYEFRA